MPAGLKWPPSSFPFWHFSRGSCAWFWTGALVAFSLFCRATGVKHMVSMQGARQSRQKSPLSVSRSLFLLTVREVYVIRWQVLVVVMVKTKWYENQQSFLFSFFISVSLHEKMSLRFLVLELKIWKKKYVVKLGWILNCFQLLHFKG